MRPLLVDSSAWISFFSSSFDPSIAKQIETAKKEKRLATCGIIYLEILRGARGKKDYKELKEEFQSMTWLIMEESLWDMASQIAFHLAKRGLQPPATDIFIATLAITHQCQLLHKDKHFHQIAKYFPLRLI